MKLPVFNKTIFYTVWLTSYVNVNFIQIGQTSQSVRDIWKNTAFVTNIFLFWINEIMVHSGNSQTFFSSEFSRLLYDP